MSPFLDSPTIRPLYDVHNGGPPKGFRCEFGSWTNNTFHNQDGVKACGRVTRTLSGMRTHQYRCHGIKQQLRLDFDSVKAIAEK